MQGKHRIQENWTKILEFVKKEFEITDVSYRIWLLPLEVYDVEDHIVTILVDDQAIHAQSIGFIRNKSGLFIKTAYEEVFGEPCDLDFIFHSLILIL